MNSPNGVVRLASRAFGICSRRVADAPRRGSLCRGSSCVFASAQGPHLMGRQGGATIDTKRHFNGEEEGKSAPPDIDLSNFTHEVKVEMPVVGEDEESHGVIEKWYKKEGDIIKRDEVICDIRTELFTFGMLTDDDYDSVMGEILIPEESDPIEPGTVICTTLNQGQDEEKAEKDEE